MGNMLLSVICTYLQQGQSVLQTLSLGDVEDRPLEEELSLHLYIAARLRLPQTLDTVLAAVSQLLENFGLRICNSQEDV